MNYLDVNWYLLITELRIHLAQNLIEEKIKVEQYKRKYITYTLAILFIYSYSQNVYEYEFYI